MITELTSHLQKFYLLYQWDKSTDEARLAVLHAFIHYQTQLTIIQDLLIGTLGNKHKLLNNFFVNKLAIWQEMQSVE